MGISWSGGRSAAVELTCDHCGEPLASVMDLVVRCENGSLLLAHLGACHGALERLHGGRRSAWKSLVFALQEILGTLDVPAGFAVAVREPRFVSAIEDELAARRRRARPAIAPVRYRLRRSNSE